MKSIELRLSNVNVSLKNFSLESIEKEAVNLRQEIKLLGPWKLVSYMEKFGGQTYFANIPSKFISNDGKTAWICYSSDWSNHIAGENTWESKPEGSGYKMCLQHLEFAIK